MITYSTPWITARNVDEIEIPPCSLVEITDYGRGAWVTSNRSIILGVVRPTADSVRQFAVNSPRTMPAGGFGHVATIGIVAVRVDELIGTVSIGDILGTEEDGFSPLIGADGLLVVFIPTVGSGISAAPSRRILCSIGMQGGRKQHCHFYTSAAFTTSSSEVTGVIYAQYGPGQDHETTSGVTFKNAPNDVGPYIFEGDSGDYGLADYSGSGTIWYIKNMECP